MEQIAALPLMSPADGFADRVMASVVVPDPFAIRSLQATQRRLFATRKSVAVAASLALLLLGSMAGSIALEPHPPGDPRFDRQLAPGSGWAGRLAQPARPGLQPDRAALVQRRSRRWWSNPVRLAIGSALASHGLSGGYSALRRLLALPTQQVAHAGI